VKIACKGFFVIGSPTSWRYILINSRTDGLVSKVRWAVAAASHALAMREEA